MIINVLVKSRAKGNKVEKDLFGDTLIVYTKEPAIEGRANYSVIEILSKYFDVPKKNIQIKSGLTSKLKRIEIITK